MPEGTVLRSTGSRYLVLDDDGTQHDCVAKGRLRIKGWKSTNPVAVGDRVTFDPQTGPDEPGGITDLHDRRNYLVRRSVNLSHQRHVIAANVDQALLMVTLARPRTSYGFIDRFLVTAEAYRVPVVIVFNKLDDLSDKELELLADYKDTYDRIGYRTIITSALQGIGVGEVKELLKDHTTLLAGHSGVGKSTLINAIDPTLDLHTAEVSRATSKGQHTTTYAEMFPLRDGGFVIDTPGVKGFGLVDLEAADIVDQFPELFALKGECRFQNCLHKQEPGCAVRKAVEEDRIPATRYASYLEMLADLDEESPYRVG